MVDLGDAFDSFFDSAFDGLFDAVIPPTENFFNLQIKRFIEDNNIPNTTEESVIKAILDDNRNILDELTKGFANSTIHKFDNFANDPATNIRSRVFTDTVHFDKVKQQIEENENTSVNIDYYRYHVVSFKHLTKQILVEDFGWDPTTNIIASKTQEKGYNVYLDAARFIASDEFGLRETRISSNLYDKGFRRYPKPRISRTRNHPDLDNLDGFFDWERFVDDIFPPSPTFEAEIAIVWASDNNINEDSVLNDANKLNSEKFKINLLNNSNLKKHKDTTMAKYHYFDFNNNRIEKYWTYAPGKGIYPDIDNLKSRSPAIFDNPFPVLNFRSNGKRRAFSSDIRKADRLGIDFNSLNDSIHETENIEETNNVALVMLVPLNTENPAELEYLFRYFKTLADDIQINNTFEQAAITDISRQQSIWTNLGTSSHQLTFDSINYKNKSGNLNPKGTYSSVTEEITKTFRVPPDENDPANSNGEKDLLVAKDFTFKVKVFRYQKTDSVFEEVRVLNPIIQYEFDEADAGDVPLTGPDNEQAVVFLDRAVSKAMPLQKQETLYNRSLHLIFMSSKEVKKEWYQTTFFKAVLTAATVTLTLSGLGSAFNFVAASFAKAGIVGAALAIAQIIVVGFAISTAAGIIAIELGAEAALAFAAVTAVASFGFALSQGSFSQSFNAKFLLAFSSNLINASNAETRDEIEEITKDREKFLEKKKEKLEQLESTETLLDTNSIVDPGFFRRRKPALLKSETPDQFFQRTIHSGNIGTLAFDAQENYVNLMLQLPSLDSNPIDTIKI